MSWAEEQSWFGTEDMVLDQEERERELLENHIWEARDGSLYNIHKMETNHIKNCIKMIYKSNGQWRHEYLRLFEEELRRRKYE